MIHHMTQRCALIRIYREVEPLLCYGQERCFDLKAWFCVSDLCVYAFVL